MCWHSGAAAHLTGPLWPPLTVSVVWWCECAPVASCSCTSALSAPTTLTFLESRSTPCLVLSYACFPPPRAPFLLRLSVMPSLPQFNPLRFRSYVFRLPLATRLLVAAIVGLWIAAIPLPWLRELGSLSPDKFDLTQSMCISSGMLRLFYVVEGCACNIVANLENPEHVFHELFQVNIRLTLCSPVHRLNLFPLTHLGFFHMFFDVLAITPLLERFEAEFGTIVTLSLFTGRKDTTACIKKSSV